MVKSAGSEHEKHGLMTCAEETPEGVVLGLPRPNPNRAFGYLWNVGTRGSGIGGEKVAAVTVNGGLMNKGAFSLVLRPLIDRGPLPDTLLPWK